MSKKEALKELNEATEAVQALADQAQGVLIPWEIVESLLITQANSNRAGTAAVCQQIRELSQDQMPEKFPK